MLTLLNVRDQSTAGLGQTEHMFNVRVPAETISVRELIRKRVYQEVREYNRHRPEFFHLLVQPGRSRADPLRISHARAALHRPTRTIRKGHRRISSATASSCWWMAGRPKVSMRSLRRVRRHRLRS